MSQALILDQCFHSNSHHRGRYVRRVYGKVSYVKEPLVCDPRFGSHNVDLSVSPKLEDVELTR